MSILAYVVLVDASIIAIEFIARSRVTILENVHTAILCG